MTRIHRDSGGSPFGSAFVLSAGWIVLLIVLYDGLLVSWGVPQTFLGHTGFDLYASGWVVWRSASLGSWSLVRLLQLCNALVIVFVWLAATGTRAGKLQRVAVRTGFVGGLLLLGLSQSFLWSIGSRTPAAEWTVVPWALEDVVPADEALPEPEPEPELEPESEAPTPEGLERRRLEEELRKLDARESALRDSARDGPTEPADPGG